MNSKLLENSFELIKDKLYRFALQLIKNKDEAQDLVQDTFLKAYDMGDKIDEIKNFEAWCMRVIKNMALDRMKSLRYKNTQGMNESLNQTQSSESPIKVLEAKEVHVQIKGIIAKLPSDHVQVFHLRDIEGYTYDEIAEVLELKLSQVKTYLFRARQRIRKELLKIERHGL